MVVDPAVESYSDLDFPMTDIRCDEVKARQGVTSSVVAPLPSDDMRIFLDSRFEVVVGFRNEALIISAEEHDSTSSNDVQLELRFLRRPDDALLLFGRRNDVSETSHDS